ncbi:PH domain-containing protein, partial [Candidatus Saccharibacteria bacterium]|nr:PH domain-containing protein [Candidatus Saccharibacteria bacterium]
DRYEGGYALLTVTNLRLLLVDRKPMFLMLEDLRFDMIVELDYSARLLGATLRVVTPTRTLTFRARNSQRLRAILDYTQQRIAEMRQPHLVQQLQPSFKQQSQAPAVGDLAMRASLSYRWTLNPYAEMPMLLRRRIARGRI